MTARPSVVFLDRDGTIIRDVNYLAHPDQVELLPGAAEAIRRLNVAEIPVIVVTNQSGIARRIFTVGDYEQARARLDELLAEHGARIDASYFCPHLPDISGECDCRKPAVGLFRRAASERSLDMSSAIFVGDRWRDVAPVRELRGRAFLVLPDTIAAEDSEDVALARGAGIPLVRSLADAVDRILDASFANVSRARIAVLASGSGTNLQAILDHFAALGEARSGDVVLVASNRSDAGALERGRRASIPVQQFHYGDGNALLRLLYTHDVDIIALAGYLKLVPGNVIEQFPGRTVNVHPGPLPRFGGPGMYGARVHDAVIRSGASRTAVTVHFVDEQFDHGAVLAQWPVPVEGGDTAASLAARVLNVEHIVYPRILDALAATVARGAVGQTYFHFDANRAPLGL
ncbi:MAG: HAD-IIIA family hydrolase [Gemmatimonadaceae bacterium]